MQNMGIWFNTFGLSHKNKKIAYLLLKTLILYLSQWSSFSWVCLSPPGKTLWPVTKPTECMWPPKVPEFPVYSSVLVCVFETCLKFFKSTSLIYTYISAGQPQRHNIDFPKVRWVFLKEVCWTDETAEQRSLV